MPTNTSVRISRELKTISVKKFIDDYIYRIDLEADYQREKIWSREDQERLLDSIIKNIDIPKIYLARIKDNKNFDYECIDGKQRMATLLDFFKPEPDEDNPLAVRIAGEKYNYKRLRTELPNLATKLEDFELSFVIYPETVDDTFLREIFRRLQLGVRLISGELLKTFTGTIRDFIYKEMSRDIPFLRNTGLSDKRFSKQFTLAQICINSFNRTENGIFVRARYDDLEDFFNEKSSLKSKDENLVRIREVLRITDKQFGDRAAEISSRAAAVSAYLFVEGLYTKEDLELVPAFINFYVALLKEVKENLTLLSHYEKPRNSTVLEEFQKYISQASVESYAIKRRNLFLEKGFAYYLNPKTKGKIIGGS